MSDNREPDLVFEEEEKPVQGPPGSYFDKNGLLVNPDTSPKEEDFVSEEELQKERAAAEPPPAEGPTREELLEEQKRLQAQYEAANRKGDEVTALRESMDGIKEALAGVRTPQPVQQPGESDKEFEARINDGFVEDPTKAILEVFNRKAAPYFQDIAAKNLYWSRKWTEDKHPDTFGKYAADIDRMASQLDKSDPEVYEKAHNLVLASHMTEIEKGMEERIREKIVAEMQTQETPLEAPPAKPSEPTYRPGAAPKGTPSERVTYNAMQRRLAEQIGLAKYGGASEWRRVIRSADNMVKGGRAKDMNDALGRLR